MNKIIIFALTTAFTGAIQPSAHAEFYKYQASGNSIHITNDSSAILAERVESSQAVETQKPKRSQPVHSGEKATQSDPLSSEDLALIELMRSAGLIPNDIKNEDIQPALLEMLKAQAKSEGFDEAYIRKKSRPDSRFSSPGATWSAYQEALIRGDVEAALDCFMPNSVKKYREAFTALGKDKLQNIAKQMKPIQKIKQDEQSAEYSMLRDVNGQERIFFIYFNRLWDNWKIDSL